MLSCFSFVGKTNAFKVMIDSANGAAYGISPFLLNAFGFDTVSINDAADGTFPNRLPEPSESNLQASTAIFRRSGCNIGFCHDGDADRMMVIDDKGRVVHFDRFLAFLCRNHNQRKTQQVLSFFFFLWCDILVQPEGYREGERNLCWFSPLQSRAPFW